MGDICDVNPEVPVAPVSLSEREGIVKIEGRVRVNGDDRVGTAVSTVGQFAFRNATPEAPGLLHDVTGKSFAERGSRPGAE